MFVGSQFGVINGTRLLGSQITLDYHRSGWLALSWCAGKSQIRGVVAQGQVIVVALNRSKSVLDSLLLLLSKFGKLRPE